MKDIIKLIRPQQWLKNVFVFMPLFFGGELLNPAKSVGALVAFLAFCLAASSIYCLNDLVDVKADRRHPVKCHRPIASGAVKEWVARVLQYLLLVVSLALPLCSDWLLSFVEQAYPHNGCCLPGSGKAVASVIGGYWLMNVAYCRWLKRYAIIDVCIVATGFVLRILVGGVATSIMVSKWLVLMTFLLTLFMSFAKRRDDVIRMEKTGEAPRQNTSRYNREFINQAITITAAVTLVCYIMYTVSPEVAAHFHTDYLYLTTVFVLVGLLRYIQLTVVDNRSGDPTKLILRDRFTQCIALAWGMSFLLIIYLL